MKLIEKIIAIEQHPTYRRAKIYLQITKALLKTQDQKAVLLDKYKQLKNVRKSRLYKALTPIQQYELTFKLSTIKHKIAILHLKLDRSQFQLKHWIKEHIPVDYFKNNQ